MNIGRLLRILCTAALVISSTISISCQSTLHSRELPKPDTIYVNGTVITMDSADNTAQAVAVSGDKIIAVGTND